MERPSLFSGKTKQTKKKQKKKKNNNIISLSCAKLAQSVVKLHYICFLIVIEHTSCSFFLNFSLLVSLAIDLSYMVYQAGT